MGKSTGQKIEEMGYEKLPNFKRIQLPTFIKSFDEEKGIVDHFVAIAGNVDAGGDRIRLGAFHKSITERGPRVKVLDQHSTDSVTRIVGKPLALREVDRSELTPEVLAYAPDATGGLLATTQYAIDTTRGRDVFNLVKGGFAPEASIGYDATETEDTKEIGPDGRPRIVRDLKQVRLWEYSNVIWGMNPATSVVSAKAAIEGKPYRAIREGDKWEVYKLDDEGEPAGRSLGSHDSEEEAQQQVEALYANDEKEIKAGRVLNARNAARIKNAYNQLKEALEEAGLMEAIEEAIEEDNEGPQKSETPTFPAQEAGPSVDDSTRLLLAIEKARLELLEV